MPHGGARPRIPARGGESEKTTFAPASIEPGHVDPLVGDSAYADRADFIRPSGARKSVEIGLGRCDRAEREQVRAGGTPFHNRVPGLVVVAPGVTRDFARAAIASIGLLGRLGASPRMRPALADRHV